MLRAALRQHALPPLAQDENAASGIVTVAIPNGVDAAEVAAALAGQGIQIAYQSLYLRQRNWLQICLMGELDHAALRLLPGAMAKQVALLASESSCQFPTTVRYAPPRRPTAPA